MYGVLCITVVSIGFGELSFRFGSIKSSLVMLPPEGVGMEFYFIHKFSQ